jgi:hypothetical protein
MFCTLFTGTLLYEQNENSLQTKFHWIFVGVPLSDFKGIIWGWHVELNFKSCFAQSNTAIFVSPVLQRKTN